MVCAHKMRKNRDDRMTRESEENHPVSLRNPYAPMQTMSPPVNEWPGTPSTNLEMWSSWVKSFGFRVDE